MQTPHEHEENERVVYSGLETDSPRHHLLLSPDDGSSSAQSRGAALAARTKAAGDGHCGHQLYPRPRYSLFELEDSGDEAGKEVHFNPFESLLQQQQTLIQKTTEAVAPRTEVVVTCCSGTETRRVDSSRTVATGDQSKKNKTKEKRRSGRLSSCESSSYDSYSNRGLTCSILKPNQTSDRLIADVNTSVDRKLGFEAAESRPARWSSRKPSAADTKNRRKSLNGIQRRRSQGEADDAKRRKSMPANSLDQRAVQNRTIVDGKMDGPKQLMSDVLRRATLLSQQQQAGFSAASFCQYLCCIALLQKDDENPMVGDAILDTEHQMRAERFTPEVFSPTKPASTSAAHSRKPNGDTIVSKIRGSIGDVIRKATRKSNRDLTLLRSHGQHLLPQQTRHSSSTASIGVIEPVQDRAYVVIRLIRFCGTLPDFIAYECRMHQVTSTLEKTAADDLVKDSVLYEAHFRPQTAEYLKLSPGNLLKVFEPLHFFLEHVASGSVRKPRWFLASTQLTQVIDDDRHFTE